MGDLVLPSETCGSLVGVQGGHQDVELSQGRVSFLKGLTRGSHLEPEGDAVT